MRTETKIRTGFIPSLENGDNLMRFEFERRYDATRDLKKAELIDGIVYLSDKGKMIYAKSRGKIIALIAIYNAATMKTKAACHGTLIFDDENELQPDAVLFINKDCGGKAFINDENFLEGAPELIIEIAASSVSYDSQ
ncbi:MAG: Uma2 family endonuclease [Pyrinomonadaceae bacterium]|nr:Uma2 family endonuclease [Pyrinomonadaceae bacterium]